MKTFSQRAITLAASVSDGLPPMQIEDFKEITKESFALILSSVATSKPYSQNDYHEALASMTDNKLGIVPGSMFKTDHRTPVFRCIAATNREVLPYSDSELKKRGMFTTVANLLEDNNGHIWRIVGNGETKQIVQVTEDDYTDLLANRRRRAQMTASFGDDSTGIEFVDTDYLYFYNPKLEAMDFGFSVKSGNKDYAYSRELKDTVQIAPHQVVAAASTDGYGLELAKKRREMTAARSSGGMSDYISYLRELYGKNSEYVRAWERAIKNSPDLVR